MFDELAKIEVREERETPKSDLDKILDAEGEIIKQYEKDERFEMNSGKHSEGYQSLYKKTQEKLANIHVTPEILQLYIDARENTEDSPKTVIRGMYSAALLEIICTTQPDTHTFIDGRGKTFDFLFFEIHNIKNLTLINISGNFILYNAGSQKGSAEYITLHNITGDWTLGNAGSQKGSAQNITLQKIEGDHTFFEAARNSGNLEHITLTEITGNSTLYNAGYEGSIANITLSKIKGDETLYNAGSQKGSAQNITLSRIEGKETLKYSGSDKGIAKQILQEKELTEKQKNLLSRIETIVETIHTLSFEQQRVAHDEIARLQIEIFAGET